MIYVMYVYIYTHTYPIKKKGVTLISVGFPSVGDRELIAILGDDTY